MSVPEPTRPDDGSDRDRARARAGAGASWPRTLAPGVVLVVLGTAAFAGLLDALWEQDDVWQVDHPVLTWFAVHRTAWLTTALTGVTNAFGPTLLPLVVALGCLVWGWWRRRWWEPGLLAGALILATAISSVAKVLVARPRPPDSSMTVPGIESTFSFPSGHTTGAATLVLVLGYLVWSHRRTRAATIVWGVVSVVVVGVVGSSRLYLGYHFVTDVLGGVSVAVIVLGVVVCVDRARARRRGLPTGRVSDRP